MTMHIGKLSLDLLEKWVDGLIVSRRVFGVQDKIDLSGGLSGDLSGIALAKPEVPTATLGTTTDRFAFAPLAKAADLRLDYDIAVTAPKAFFQPACETLLEFSAPSEFKSVIENEKFVLLGVHPYDMAAINQMDKIFSSDNPGFHRRSESYGGQVAGGYVDSPSRSAMAERGASYDAHYMSRRNNAVIVGCDVQIPAPNVFAACMNTAVVREGFDVLLTRIGEEYLAEAMTQNGENLLSGADGMKEASASDLELREAVWEKNRKLLRLHELRVPLKELPGLLEKSYDHPVWEEKAQKCFSCGSCNLVCPTCYCFDVRDETRWDLHGGVRNRFWDGCLLRDFATVAGGHNFRKKREERYRHRYYRKGKYMPDKIGAIACVGCGRCISACVTKIANPVEVYNRLLEAK